MSGACMPPCSLEERRGLDGRFMSNNQTTSRSSMPPIFSQEHNDLTGRLEFFEWSRQDGGSQRGVAVGVATNDDLIHIAEEEGDPSIAECVVVANIEHTRLYGKRVKYSFKLGNTYSRTSYEAVSRWYPSLWEEQIMTGGTTLQLGRSIRITNILEGIETPEQAMATKLNPQWIHERQSAKKESAIQAAERQSTQGSSDKANQSPRQVLKQQVKHKIKLRAVSAMDNHDNQAYEDSLQAPRPKRSVGVPERFRGDADSCGSGEESSYEPRQKRPCKIVKLSVKQPRDSESSGGQASSSASEVNTSPALHTSQVPAGAATTLSTLPRVVTEEAKTALPAAVRSTPRIKAERAASATTTPSDLANSLGTQQQTPISAPAPQSSTLAQVNQAPTNTTEKLVLFLRSRLQSGFLSSKSSPKESEVETMARHFESLEQLGDLKENVIKATKIHKVMKAITKLANIPKDEKHKFKARSMALWVKYEKILGQALPVEPAITVAITPILPAQHTSNTECQGPQQTKAERDATAASGPLGLANSASTQQHITISASTPQQSAPTQVSRQALTTESSVTAAATTIMPQETKQTDDTAKKQALRLLTEASSGLCDPEAVQLAVQTLTGQQPPLSIIQRATFARVVTRSVESIYDFHAYRQWFQDNEVSMMADDSAADAM